jgi:hypothetical protein
MTTAAGGRLESLPEPPTREGFTFAGWTPNNNNVTMHTVRWITTDWVFASNGTDAANRTAHARWKSNDIDYTITFDSRGGTEFAPMTTNTEGKVILPTPAKAVQNEGGSFTFKGWYTDTVNGQLITNDTVFLANTNLFAMYIYDSGSDGGKKAGFEEKPRVIVTNDGERDDLSSIVRFLLFANEFDVEGIVLTSSMWHNASQNSSGRNWMSNDVMLEWIDAYGEGYENLIKHDPSFPTPEYLRSVTKMGNIVGNGAASLGVSTEGSNLIKDVLLDRSDDRPIYILAWGGPNSIAQALNDIRAEYMETPEWEEIKAYVSSKAILNLVLDQDGTFWSDIIPHWPDMRFNHVAHGGLAYSYNWRNVTGNSSSNPTSHLQYFRGNFSRDFFVHPFLDTYEGSNYNEGLLFTKVFTHGNGKTTPEGSTGHNSITGNNARYDWHGDGDSLSFMNLIEYGLRASECVSYGGWGGRKEQRFGGYRPGSIWSGRVGDVPAGTTNYWVDKFEPNTIDLVDWGNYPNNRKCGVARWSKDMQNELAVRASWLISPPGQVTQPPVVTVNTELDINAIRGQQIAVNGSGVDPHGGDVKLDWFYYRDASTYARVTNFGNGLHVNNTYTADVAFVDDGNGQIVFSVPEDAKAGDTIHMILTGTNRFGGLELSRYQRVIVTVRDPADYNAVDAAIELVEALDRDLYTWQSLAVVDAAVDAVVRELLDIDQDVVDGFAAAILEALDSLELLKMTDATTNIGNFISITETSKNSREWVLTFIVTKTYNDETINEEQYSIMLRGNNANLDGRFTFDTEHELAGLTLIYDIKGNGSNIKALRLE